MASIAKKFVRATNRIAGGAAKVATVPTRAALNPSYMFTDKIANTVIPGYSQKVNNITSEILNPISQTNRGVLLSTATTLNPVEQVKNLTTVGTNLINQGTDPKKKRIIPDRSGYSAAAGASASQAAKNEAAAKVQAEKSRIIPDRSGYSASAGANANIASYAKSVHEEEEREAAKGRGDAWNNASTRAAVNQVEKSKDSPTPAQDAANISAMYPDETELLKYYADLSRWDGMNQTQNLPEVVVQSDYKKYFIWGGLALLAIIAWKKIK